MFQPLPKSADINKNVKMKVWNITYCLYFYKEKLMNMFIHTVRA